MQKTQVHQIKTYIWERLKKKFGNFHNIGLGITSNDEVKVNFTNREDLRRADLPSEIDGISIITEVTGPIKTRPK